MDAQQPHRSLCLFMVSDAHADQRFADTTRAERKLGLGLSTAAKRLHSLGGQLSLEHTSPQGSVFLLELPTQS